MVRTMGPTAARPNWCMSADSVPFAGGTLAANGTLMKIQMLKEFSTNGTAFKVKDMATELQAELSKPFLAYPFVTEIRVRATVDLDWFRSSTGPKGMGRPAGPPPAHQPQQQQQRPGGEQEPREGRGALGDGRGDRVGGGPWAGFLAKAGASGNTRHR